MQARFFNSLSVGVLAAANVCLAANFGTVVPIHGSVSDIALDEGRGRVYAANFSAYRVEVVDTATRRLLPPIAVQNPPSSVAVSPDGRYLVIGEYQTPICLPGNTLINPFGDPIFDGPGDHLDNISPCTFDSNSGGITVVDLQANSQLARISLGAPVLSVTFGSDNNALVVLRNSTGQNAALQTNVFLLIPGSGTLQPINVVPAGSDDLPVPLVTFPAEILRAAGGASGDRNTIFVLVNISTSTAVIRYDVASQTADLSGVISSPALGPSAVSVDRNGDNFVAGWVLLHRLSSGKYHHWAEFPRPDGRLNIGSHAWDINGNTIYAQVPSPDDGSVLHIMDTDNLTVRERIQLQEYLTGKSIIASDSSVMYSASISGLTILPIGQLPQTPRLGAKQEDLLFTSDACNNLGVQQFLDISSLSSAQTDFTLSLPNGVSGVSFSRTSGTTPAHILVNIDPAAFQGVSGTTGIPLTITSTGAVNLPPAVRLLVNTRDFNQRGQIVNVPGKLVDILADPVRERLYVVRQDKNLVLVYDTTASPPRLFSTFRTGNTPTKAAMTTDRKYLMVGNDHSQIANVFDLDALQPSAPILFYGHYPRTLGVANTGMFATVRFGAVLDNIDFGNRVAVTPPTLDGGPNPAIFPNKLPSEEGVLTATQDSNYLLLAFPDGTVAEYDGFAQAWAASRKDVSGLAGAYAAMNIAANRFQAFPDGVVFLAGANLFNAALVPAGDAFADNGAQTSGVASVNNSWIRTTSTGAAGPGVIQRIDFASLSGFNGTAMAEAPVTKDSLLTPTVGQIGETVLPFTRSLAVSASQSKIFALTVSGLTVLPPNFDAVLAKPAISSVVNSADGSTALAAGGDININGVNLAPAPVSAGAPPLPTSLGDVCAVLGTTPLPLFSVSSPLLVAQLPFLAGTSSLVIHTPGGISDPFPVSVATQAPAIFSAIRDDNNEPLNFTNPLHPNTEITIYMTGLGVTDPLPALGDVPPGGQVAQVIAPPTVRLGSANMSVISASLTPDQVGVYQIKAKVPEKVQPGRSVPLTVVTGGVSASIQVRVVSP